MIWATIFPQSSMQPIVKLLGEFVFKQNISELMWLLIVTIPLL